MSRLECERWASLLDREALESPLSPEETQFKGEHVRGCVECARELSVWRELEALNHASSGELERDLLLEDSVLQKLWHETPRPIPRLTSPRQRLAIFGGLLAAAAAVSLFVLPRSDRPVAGAAVAHVTIGSGKAQVGPGALRHSGEAVQAGETLRAGESPLCLLIESGVRACLAPGGEVRVADATLAHRRLDLLSGRLVASLEPQLAGTTFSVSARAALVTAVGTIFAVEVAEQRVMVRVMHGAVSVRSGDANERELRAHESLVFGVEKPVALAAEQEAEDLALLSMGVQALPAASSAASSTPAAGSVVTVESSAVASVAKPPASATEASSAAELLRRALELRSQGRFPEAAQVYGKLVSSHRGSPEAQAALVSLGDLQLSRLNNAAAALRSFDSYLAGGGRALQQEAEYGRIRALRALGRAAEEQRAIERLIARYPSGVHADSMRARLQSLQGDGSR